MRVVILFFLASTLLLNCKNETPATANTADSPNANGTEIVPGLAVGVDSNFMHLDALGFQEILKKKPNTAIFDLRSAEDYNKGHIYKAINRPYSDSIAFLTYFNDLGPSQPIALYDTNGYISNKVGAALVSSHSFVYILKEGIYSWYAAQIPVVTF